MHPAAQKQKPQCSLLRLRFLLCILFRSSLTQYLIQYLIQYPVQYSGACYFEVDAALPLIKSSNILEKYRQFLFKCIQDQHCKLPHLRMCAAIDPQPEKMSPFS